MNLKFSIEEIFLAVGQKDRTGIFEFYPASESYEQFGERIQGVVLYKKRERDDLIALINANSLQRSEGLVRIEVYDTNQKNYNILIERGFNNRDVMRLSNFVLDEGKHPYAEVGVKTIPNTINIPFDFSNSDYVSISINFNNMRLREGVVLPKHELVKHYSYTSILYPELISEEVKHNYLTDPITGEYSREVQLITLIIKAEQDTLMDDELTLLQKIEGQRLTERLAVILKAYSIPKQKFGLLSKSAPEIFWGIFNMLRYFETETLSGPGNKHPIFWDFERFAHVMTKHFVDLNIPQTATGTTFQYKQRDVSRLAHIAVKKLATEIDESLSNGKDFARTGGNAFYYNGNHYNIRVRKDGLLTQFHPLEHH